MAASAAWLLAFSGKTSCAARVSGLVSGTDCFGAAQPAVRYDSPTWGGFSFQTSWGKQEAVNPIFGVPSQVSNFWDAAVMYTADWNSIKLSAAYTYTWMESGLLTGSFQQGFCDYPTEDGRRLLR